jgi:uncharacterized RmlC-like cupin family protein
MSLPKTNLDMAISCSVVKATSLAKSKQELMYFSGVSAETVGASQLCMHTMTVPSGVRAKAHKHEHHETAIYVLSGEAYTLYGDQLQHVQHTAPGDFLFIPAGIPHLPINIGKEPVLGIVARTDPNQEEDTVLLPELEAIAEIQIQHLLNQISSAKSQSK